MKTTATLYGTPEQEVKAKIDFEYYQIKKWFGEASTIFVNFCKVETPLFFSPSDLKMDLEIAIAEAFGERPENIRLECEVEYSVKPAVELPVYETEFLFI